MADSKQDNTPYVDALLEYSARETGRFQVPGHKGGLAADPAMVELVGMTGLINDVPSVTEGVDIGPEPTPFQQAQLLAAEAGIDDHPASTRVHLAGGFWLILRAARLAADEPGSGSGHGDRGAATIVVTIEEASAAGRLDLFARAYGLTGREQELLGVLATGSDTRAMARQMALSEHTIQDHLKSIFTKTGARDRVTVLSRALGTRAGLRK